MNTHQRHVVTRLGTTPVKGLRLHQPAEIELDAQGAMGDRDFCLVNERDQIVSVTKLGLLVRLVAVYEPDAKRLTVSSDRGVECDGEIRLGDPVTVQLTHNRSPWPAREVLGPWSDVFSVIAGRPLRLVKTDTPGGASDAAPVTLLGEGSLDHLVSSSSLGSVDPRRFRMLIQFGSLAPYVEDTWAGRVVTIGEASVRVGGPVPRCAATMRHPEQGEQDLPTVREIHALRGRQPTMFGDGVPFGVYAEVLTPGRIRVGDELTVPPSDG